MNKYAAMTANSINSSVTLLLSDSFDRPPFDWCIASSMDFGSIWLRRQPDITVNLSPDTWKINQDYVARDSTTFVFYELASTDNLLLHTFGKLSVWPEVFNFESL